jgi:hypothetical protein
MVVREFAELARVQRVGLESEFWRIQLPSLCGQRQGERNIGRRVGQLTARLEHGIA